MISAKKCLAVSYTFVWAAMLVTLCASQAAGVYPWVPVPLPPNVEYFNVLTAGKAYLFAAMVDSSQNELGVFRTPLDAPGDWEYLGHEGRRVRGIVVAGDNDSHLLVGASGDTLAFRSTTGGQTWEPSAEGILLDQFVAMESNGLLPGQVYISAKLNAYYGDSAGVYASSDFGITWTYWHECYPCLTSGFVYFAVPQNHHSLAWAMEYTGFWEDRPWRTTDSGTMWELIEGHWTDLPPRDFDVAAADPLETFLLVPTGFFRWWNGGEFSWFATPFYSTWGNLALVSPSWHWEYLYILGMDGNGAAGVASACAPWQAWTDISEGLPEDELPGPLANYFFRYHLEHAPQRPLLFASLWGLGLWMRDMSDFAAVTEYPQGPDSELRLLPVRPNPATGTVTCEIFGWLGAAPHACIVDLTGRTVRRLALPPAGDRVTLSWNGRDEDGRRVPSGVYYFSVINKETTLRRPVMIMR